METKLKKYLASKVKDAYGIDVEVELAPSRGKGDLATNLALTLSKELKDNPMNIAEKIIKGFKFEGIKKCEVAKPGFINLYYSDNFYRKIVEKIIKEGKDFGRGNSKRKVNVEFVSANPTGHLHIGHARGAALGSALVSILRFAGNTVDSEYYINDAGNQINTLGHSAYIRYQNLFGKTLSLPKESYRGKEIIDAAKHIKDNHGDEFVDKELPKVMDTFKLEAREYLLGIIKKHLSEFNVIMDIYSSELEMYLSGNIDKSLKKLSPHTYEKDGALWLRTKEFGDDVDRVLIKSDGSYTYILPDIAYHNEKLSRGYDELINIWGGDHIGYIKRMEIALQYLGLDPQDLDVIVVQMVRIFKDGQEFKMSKRKGTAYTLEDLVKEVGADASRWYLLDRSPNSQFIFDLNKASEKSSDNPVYTVQYTHARINQLIKKSNAKVQTDNYVEKETKIINILNDFPELITNISINHKVHTLTQYILELVREFNSWYSNSKIIGSEREASQITLAKAVMIVLKNALTLLGISAPEKM